MNQRTPSPISTPTLDTLFQRTCARTPDALALVDPSDKLRVTGTAPRRLTYAEANQAIDALAAHFAAIGLPSNSVIGVQLPNTVEFALVLLAAHRAGLIVAILPQLWRQNDLALALNRVGARAIVAHRRIDGVDHADIAMNAAAEVFSIRSVLGFGDDLPEGMTGLDAVDNGEAREFAHAPDGRRAALISFDVVEDGLLAVPRTHAQMIAGGLALASESRLPQAATILSTLAPSSFATVTASLTLWLLTGGALVLHHPFDADLLEQQAREHNRCALVAPAAVLAMAAKAGMFKQLPGLTYAIGLWRSPEQATAALGWPVVGCALTDVLVFGEIGLQASARGIDGQFAPLSKPTASASAYSAGSAQCELVVTAQGTVSLRGPMVPVAAYAASLKRPPAGRDADFAREQADTVDTGYRARSDVDGQIAIGAPPNGSVNVGGYRFRSDELHLWSKRLGQAAVLTTVPDRLNGFKIVGRAIDTARARAVLSDLGLNPLISEAFRDRPIQPDESVNPPLT